MYSWTLPCISSLVPSVLHLSHGFQCSPTLNRQPYEGRLPLTSWWRKLSNMTVGQSSLIYLAHHCYDWHPGSRCGWTCNQLTSKVDGGICGRQIAGLIRLRCFIPRLISPMHQTCIRLLLNSSVDPAIALLNSSVNPSIQPELKTDAPSCCR